MQVYPCVWIGKRAEIYLMSWVLLPFVAAWTHFRAGKPQFSGSWKTIADTTCYKQRLTKR